MTLPDDDIPVPTPLEVDIFKAMDKLIEEYEDRSFAVLCVNNDNPDDYTITCSPHWTIKDTLKIVEKLAPGEPDYYGHIPDFDLPE